MKTEITSRENPTVKWATQLRESAEARRREGLFVAEGPVVLREAAQCGAAIRHVFYEEESLLEGFSLPRGTELYKVSHPVLEKLSDVKAPQGVVFTCVMPENGVLRGNKILAVESLSDPGNMGTVIRTAEAFGIDTLALVGRCADVYSPKVARAAMGAVLRVNICRADLEGLAEGVKGLGLPLYGAALSRDAVEIGEVDLRKSAVIIGNEARGLSAEALDKCDKHVIIPISGIQSLNAAVAAAIFMYEMGKK